MSNVIDFKPKQPLPTTYAEALVIEVGRICEELSEMSTEELNSMTLCSHDTGKYVPPYFALMQLAMKFEEIGLSMRFVSDVMITGFKQQ